MKNKSSRFVSFFLSLTQVGDSDHIQRSGHDNTKSVCDARHAAVRHSSCRLGPGLCVASCDHHTQRTGQVLRDQVGTPFSPFVDDRHF